jgi:hypothetical protein
MRVSASAPPQAVSTVWLDAQRRIAGRWKATTSTLPVEARVEASYVDKDGRSSRAAQPYVLPSAHAALALLPEVRADALALFDELGIPWHAGIDGGPGNHLLSSQVQCVNALGQMVRDPERLVRAFAEPLGTADVLEIEPGRYLTFEYIGPHDYFGEVPDGERVRGAYCTSVDAAFLHRTRDGLTELVLLEWKYTESYRRRRPDPAKDAVRLERYGAAWADPAGPITDALPFTDVLDEPLYQLVRQQLLAHRLEQDRVLGADRVRVVHVSPEGNVGYAESLLPAHRALGSSVQEVWQQLLRAKDRFVPLDSGLFLDPSITSPEYVLRYAPDVVRDLPDLLALTEAPELLDVEAHVYAETDFEGELNALPEGLELYFGGVGYVVAYPFRLSELLERAAEVQEELEAAVDTGTAWQC